MILNVEQDVWFTEKNIPAPFFNVFLQLFEGEFCASQIELENTIAHAKAMRDYPYPNGILKKDRYSAIDKTFWAFTEKGKIGEFTVSQYGINMPSGMTVFALLMGEFLFCPHTKLYFYKKSVHSVLADIGLLFTPLSTSTVSALLGGWVELMTRGNMKNNDYLVENILD